MHFDNIRRKLPCARRICPDVLGEVAAELEPVAEVRGRRGDTCALLTLPTSANAGNLIVA